MRRLPALIPASFLICLLLVVTGTAQNGTTLQLGTPVERQLGPNQAHQFTVNLKENSFIQLVIEQRGIDVIVKVSTPTGKSLGEYDSPTGGDGAEDISFVATAAGAYRIQVSPLVGQDATTGHFEIKILELRQATERELKANKNLEVVKARGIELLTETEGIVAQIKSPRTRIRAQLTSAQLLWDVDEKRASKFMGDAIAGLKELLASVGPNPEYSPQNIAILELRSTILNVLAHHDPEAAFNFLLSTKQTIMALGDPRERLMQESAHELSIADQLTNKDPGRALQIARQSIKSRLSSNLTNTISRLLQQKPEMAAELSREIAAKLINEKLLENPEAAGLAVSLISMSGKRLEHPPANENVAKVTLLADDQFEELLQKMLSEALAYRTPANPYSHSSQRESAWALLQALQAMTPGIETIMTGGEAAVQKKFAELSNLNRPDSAAYQEIQNLIASGSMDAALEAIEKAPSELKEQMYLHLANREVNNGDVARARQIVNNHVTNPYQRRQALANLDQQEIYRAMNSGKIEEALKGIGAFRTSKERAGYLTQMIQQFGPGLKRAAAISFLEQARTMLDPSVQARDQNQMQALLEIASAFSRYDSKRSFEMLDPLIDQLNELSAAARTMQGFGAEYYDDDDELDMNNGGSVAVTANQMARVLGTLALINFDRAKTSSDKIQLPEVRLKVYLDIAQQTIHGGQ
jgi:hypothetical protein